MKPTRRLPEFWPGIFRERQMALYATGLLFLLLAANLIYQRLQVSPGPLAQGDPATQGESGAVPGTQGVAPGAQSTEPGNQSVAPGTQAATPGPSPGGATETAPPDRLGYPLAGRPALIKPFGSMDQALGDFRSFNAHAFRTTPDQVVLAAAAGKVTSVEKDPVEGLTLVVEHGGGMSTRYGGLARALVAQGAQVESGAVIARTGGSSPTRGEMGPHLTFSVWLDGHPVDPTPLLGE